jgi:hypothetical protein
MSCTMAAVNHLMTVRLPPTRLCRSLMLAGFLGVAALAGCARNPTVGSVSVPPIPMGEARLWFYRLYLPSETLNMTKVSVNGAYAGYAQLGGTFYRDVPPGVYHIDVESYGRDFNQSTNVALVAGQDAYVRGRILTELGELFREREDGRTGHVLCSADPPPDCARRDRTTLL